MRFGTELLRQSDVLAQFTEDAPRVTRTYLSDEHKQAGEYLIGLMRRRRDERPISTRSATSSAATKPPIRRRRS